MLLKIKVAVILAVYCLAAVKCEQRIAGGSVKDIASYPFAAALLTNREDGGAYVQACGGTIITTSAILSAASCFYANGTADPVSWWRARVGSTNANSGGTIHMINRITVHPNFEVQTRVNDLAILRTTVNIALRANVTEVARIVGAAFTLETNQIVWAIGWGAVSATVTSSEQLRAVQIWVSNQNTCTTRYDSINFAVTDTMVCAGWLDFGLRGQCEGDSGSPLLDPTGAVVAVFSWAEGCAQGRYPGINTRVSPYLNWIISTALAA